MSSPELLAERDRCEAIVRNIPWDNLAAGHAATMQECMVRQIQDGTVAHRAWTLLWTGWGVQNGATIEILDVERRIPGRRLEKLGYLYQTPGETPWTGVVRIKAGTRAETRDRMEGWPSAYHAAKWIVDSYDEVEESPCRDAP